MIPLKVFYSSNEVILCYLDREKAAANSALFWGAVQALPECFLFSLWPKLASGLEELHLCFSFFPDGKNLEKTAILEQLHLRFSFRRHHGFRVPGRTESELQFDFFGMRLFLYFCFHIRHQ